MRYTTHRYNIFMKTPPTGGRRRRHRRCRRRHHHMSERTSNTRDLSRPFSIWAHTWVMCVIWCNTICRHRRLILHRNRAGWRHTHRERERSFYANFYYNFSGTFFFLARSNLIQMDLTRRMLRNILFRKRKYTGVRIVYSVQTKRADRRERESENERGRSDEMWGSWSDVHAR